VSELAPGWYKDPAEPSTQRYWDGEGWVGDALPIDVPPPSGPPRNGAPLAWPLPPPRPAPAPPAGPPPPGLLLPGLMYGVPRPHGLPVAPLGLRVLARLIDLGVVLALNVVGNGWLIYLYLSDIWPAVRKMQDQMLQSNPNADAIPAIPERARWVLLAIPLVAAALWFAYEVPAIAQRGQTLGKRAVGIRVLPLESTEPLGYLRSMRRWNPLGLPVLLYTCCGVGFLLQLVDGLSPVFGGPLRLAFHDRSAGTVVVHSGRKGHEITPVMSSGESHEPHPPGS
jgi:uncharacterized RDD family membrane protein YckC